MLTTGAAHHRGTSKQDYATPDDFIAAAVARYGPIAFDLAASQSNTKAARFFCEADDSLSQTWSELDGNLWLNPPFDNIAPWAAKCSRWATAPFRRPGLVLFLTPASVGSNWFAEHVHGAALVLALTGRLSFDGKAPYPKDCMLSVFGEAPGFDIWRWRDQR
jgi:phage N-6-adenine-methyltransferase